MKVFKLLNFYTVAKAIKSALLVMGLVIASHTASATEIAETTEVTNINNCQANVNDVTRIERELNEACRTAGLGSKRACIQTLNDCEGDDAEENESCLDNMTTEAQVKRDREELEELKAKQTELEDKIKEEQSSIVDLEAQAVEINRARDDARRELNTALADVGTQRAQAQAQENADLEQLEIAVDQAKDQLVTLELGFREFVLSRVDQCQEQAEAHRQQVYGNYVNAASRGKVKYTQHSLFRMTGMSVQEISRNQGRNMFRRCMRQRTGNREGNEPTPYGRRHEIERDKVEHQRNVLNREIRRMERKVVEVQESHRATIAGLSQVEAGHIANHQTEVLRLNQEGAILIRQERDALARIDKMQMESIGLMLDITTKENKLQKSHGEGIKMASDEEAEAYREAQQAMDSLKSAANRAQGTAERCQQANFIDGILDLFNNDDRDVASDGDLPTIEVVPDTEDDSSDDDNDESDDTVSRSAGETVN